MMRQHIARAGIARPGVRPDHAVAGERRTEDRRAHKTLDQVCGRAGQRALRSVLEARRGGIVEVERVCQRAPQSRRLGVERFKAQDVAPIERADLERIVDCIASEQERSAVEQRRERRWFFTIRVVAEGRQIQFGDDLRMQQAADV